MASLKSLIPELARALDMTSAALYERQRALVRASLLQQRPGHGPGSGVVATPELGRDAADLDSGDNEFF